MHLLYCTACRRYNRQLRAIRRAAKLVANECEQVGGAIEASLSPEARERIKAAVAQTKKGVRKNFGQPEQEL